MSHFGNRIACSIPRNLDGTFSSQRATVRRHTSSPLLTRWFCTLSSASASVNKLRTRCVTWSHRILPDHNVLRARCSHQLTQSRCHHRTILRPCCPSFHTIMLARIHVWFRQEFRINQAQTSSQLGLCRRSSLCCWLLCHCLVLRRLQRYQFSQLLDLFCCCHDSSTTLPVTIVSPVARSSETVPQPQPQVRTNAPQPCTTSVRKDKGKQRRRVQTTR